MITRPPFPAQNGFTTDIEPLDADGEPIGFTGYANGQDLTGDIDAFFHVFEKKNTPIINSASGLITCPVNHELAVGDNIFFRNHTTGNETVRVVATIPTAKTFTCTGYSGTGTGGMFHRVMKEDQTGTVLYQKTYRKFSTNVANFSIFKGAANVIKNTDYIIESWIDYGTGAAQLTKTELITIVPTYGLSPS